MSKKIKFAVIGAGHIGKRHAEMISRESEAELVALVDIRSKEECGAQDFNVPFFSTIEELLASGLEFDVLNVCTPNGLHSEQSLKGLEAKKHVVCEKPMGLTKDACEKMIFKSLQVSRQVFCVMQNRYSPPSEWIKKIVEEKVLGDIFMVDKLTSKTEENMRARFVLMKEFYAKLINDISQESDELTLPF